MSSSLKLVSEYNEVTFVTHKTSGGVLACVSGLTASVVGGALINVNAFIASSGVAASESG